ncbi:MAG: hypothetical protein ACKOB9_04525 [Solirubrobacterales bacterium]
MSTPENPQDPSGAPTEKLPAEEGAGAEVAAPSGGRSGLSDQTQKALLAVTAGLALVLSIIALVVAIAGGGHHGKGPHGDGPFRGGPRMEQRGGPGMDGRGGPMGGPQGGYYDQAPGQPGDERQGGTTTTPPERN